MGKNTQKTTILREFSAGGVVFKKERDRILWLIRRTVASPEYPKTYWMLPKGRIDDTNDDLPGPMASGLIRADEKSIRSAALREVSEETGIEAKIVEKIKTIKYSFTDPIRGKILKFVTFYLMERVGDLKKGYDTETSEIAWLKFDDAYKQLTFSGEKGILKDAKNLQEAPVA